MLFEINSVSIVNQVIDTANTGYWFVVATLLALDGVLVPLWLW